MRAGEKQDQIRSDRRSYCKVARSNVMYLRRHPRRQHAVSNVLRCISLLTSAWMIQPQQRLRGQAYQQSLLNSIVSGHGRKRLNLFFLGESKTDPGSASAVYVMLSLKYVDVVAVERGQIVKEGASY